MLVKCQEAFAKPDCMEQLSLAELSHCARCILSAPEVPGVECELFGGQGGAPGYLSVSWNLGLAWAWHISRIHQLNERMLTAHLARAAEVTWPRQAPPQHAI